jgi:hypothetical protein
VNISLSITDITPKNKRIKMIKAVWALSGRLGVPVSVEGRKSHDHGKGEPFLYRSHEDLMALPAKWWKGPCSNSPDGTGWRS